MEKNVNSMYNICKQIFPAMKEIGGRVIAISDSKVMGAADAVDHVSAEAAAHGFTHAVAREMGKYGVTSNTLRVGDNATAEDIADAVVFVSSADGRFLNKGELPVQHFPA